MVPCYPFKRDIILDYVTLIFSILVTIGLYCLGWGVFLYDKSDPMSIPCLLMSHGLALIMLLLTCGLVMEMCSYSINEYGITTAYGYGKLKKKFHSWDEVTSICLCSRQMGTSPSSYKNVIWCTFGDKYQDPRKLETLRDFERATVHFSQVLTIEYTPERLEGFRLCSHREIPDYRRENGMKT